MDIFTITLTLLIGCAFMLCGYILGYSSSVKKPAEILRSFIDDMKKEGALDIKKMNVYYKNKFGIDFDALGDKE